MKPIWLLLIVACIFSMKVQAQSFEPEEHATFQTNRTDGRFVSSRAVAHHLMKELEPAFSFRPSMQAADFKTCIRNYKTYLIRFVFVPNNGMVTDWKNGKLIHCRLVLYLFWF